MKTKEKIIEEFDKRFPTIMKIEHSIERREKIKDFFLKALSLQKQEIVEEIEKIGKKYPNDLIFSDMKQMLVHNSLMI